MLPSIPHTAPQRRLGCGAGVVFPLINKFLHGTTQLKSVIGQELEQKYLRQRQIFLAFPFVFILLCSVTASEHSGQDAGKQKLLSQISSLNPTPVHKV